MNIAGVRIRVAACILDQKSVGTVLSSGFAFADIDIDAPQLQAQWD